MDKPTTLYCKRAEAGRLIAVTGEVVGAAGRVAGPDAGAVWAATAIGVAVDVAVDATGTVSVGVTAAVEISGGSSTGGLGVNGVSGAAEALVALVEVAAAAMDSGAACARFNWATGLFCINLGTGTAAGAVTAAGAGAGAGTRGAGASMLRVANVLLLASALSASLPGRPKRVGEACSTSTCANATTAAKNASGRQPGAHWAPGFTPGRAWP